MYCTHTHEHQLVIAALRILLHIYLPYIPFPSFLFPSPPLPSPPLSFPLYLPLLQQIANPPDTNSVHLRPGEPFLPQEREELPVGTKERDKACGKLPL